MKVLQFVSGRGPTGPVAAALLDAQALRAAGHAVAVVSSNEPGVEEACRAVNLPWHGTLKLGRGAWRLLNAPGDVQRLRGWVREWGADAVHVHRTDDELLASAALGRTSHVTLIRSWHRDPAAIPGALLKRLVRRTPVCVCVAREHAARLTAAGAARAEFVPTPVDTEMFRPRAAPAVPPALVHVGRWKKERDGTDRGQTAAMNLFAALQDVPGWRGVLVGRGEMEAELRAAAFERLGLSRERVEIRQVPKTAPDAFAALLAEFSLGFVPATGSDGSSRAAAELLACGVPLAVVDRPGLREFADHACVTLLKGATPLDWAAALRPLLSDSRALAARRSGARQAAEEQHALPVRGARLAALLTR